MKTKKYKTTKRTTETQEVERFSKLCNLFEAIWLKKDEADYYNIDLDNLPPMTSPQARGLAAFVEMLFANVEDMGDGSLKCKRCGQTWSPNLRTAGERPYWVCPHGCNKEMKGTNA